MISPVRSGWPTLLPRTWNRSPTAACIRPPPHPRSRCLCAGGHAHGVPAMPPLVSTPAPMAGTGWPCAAWLDNRHSADTAGGAAERWNTPEGGAGSRLVAAGVQQRVRQGAVDRVLRQHRARDDLLRGDHELAVVTGRV